MSAAEKETTRPWSGGRLWLAAILLALISGVAGYELSHLTRPRRTETPSTPALNPMYITEHPADVDPAEFLSITSADDADAARRELIGLIWGQTSLPADLPEVAPSFLDEGEAERFAPFAASIEALVVELDAGLVTRALHFVPREGNGDVVLLHEGHDGTFLQRQREIETLLQAGFAVIGLSMPLISPNSQPELTLSSGEVIPLRMHEQLRYIEPARGHPVKYLLEPVIRIVNHVEQRTSHRRISMIGISGGGWTTVMVAALDPRVTVSVPVAGSFPVYLRALNERDWGDWEETLPEIHDRFGYLDLYLLASSGCGRKQVQVFYENDPCCYAGTAATVYEEAVHGVSRILGGSFAVVIDSDYRLHGYSPVAMETALEAFAYRTDEPCR